MEIVVPFEGPEHAKIYIVGEAPGKHRIGNVMRVRPINDKFSYFYNGKYPKPELVEGRRYLIEDIKRCNPNVVVALGNEPLVTLMGYKDIMNWRGSILWSRKAQCKVIPSIHPAALFRMWENVPLAMFDFKRVKEESESSELVIPKKNLIVKPTFAQVMDYIENFRECGKRMAFDVETTDLWITAIALSNNPLEAISIPFTLGNGAPYWVDSDEELIWKGLKRLMEDESVEKVAQNAQFDVLLLKLNPYHIDVRGLVLDTMCAHHTIYPELRKSLAVLTSIYTRQPYYKHWSNTSDDIRFWKYNAMDAAVTLEASVAIEKELKEFGVWDFYHRLVHPLIPILMEMQLRGVKIDIPEWKKFKAETITSLAELQAELCKLVGREVNVMSPKQLKKLLYRNMNLPPQYKKGTARITTDEDALKKLAVRYPSRLFDLILDIRGKRKVLSTYIENLFGEDGRARSSYIIGGDNEGVGGTETGRLSSRESIFGTGTNLQNIPKGSCRRMFIADEGKVFIESDLSQAEVRVVAYLSEETKLIDLFTKGGDIHTQNAAWIFDKQVEEVKKEEREMAKRLVHASNYGIGPRTFAHYAGIGEREAKRLLEKYFTTFPRIRSWHYEVQSHLKKNRTLVTPLGRKRTFFDRWGESLFREAYAYIPQSTVGDVLNLALIKLKEKFPDLEVMLQIHDAFVIQVPKETVGMWVSRVNEAFNIPLNIRGRTLIIPVKHKVGKNWDEMVEYKV